MGQSSMTLYYADKLEKGIEYQDFIVMELIKMLSLPLTVMQSRKYQFSIGENMQGVEIKFDDRMSSTGNVYIETCEKSRAENTHFIPSGIYRSDNTWLYLIGNYSEAFVFAKKHLVLMCETSKYRSVEISTSRGVLIPYDEAVKYCATHLKFTS